MICNTCGETAVRIGTVGSAKQFFCSGCQIIYTIDKEVERVENINDKTYIGGDKINGN